MQLTRLAALATLSAFLAFFAPRSADAQPAAPTAPPPPPLWDAQVGASFVGTSGNSDTASTGIDFAAHRRGAIWLLDSTASFVRTSADDVATAERYLGMLRGQRKLNDIIGVSSGIKLEHDRFAGLDLRSIVDGGLSWAIVHHPEWTLDGVTSLAWLHESHISGDGLDDPVGVLQLLSRIPFGTAGDTTQRVTYYPDFKIAASYRSEAEVTAQAAMSTHLALKLGWLLRYSNAPVPGFKKTDITTTASVVVRWKAATPAP